MQPLSEEFNYLDSHFATQVMKVGEYALERDGKRVIATDER